MKTYKLSAYVTISLYTEVKADSLEEAIQIAEGRSIEQYNYAYAGQRREVWVSDEFDGEPFDITEEQTT